MSDYKLKTPKQVEDTVTGACKAIEEAVAGTYQKIEDTVVGAYEKVEERTMEGYKRVERKFTDAFLERTDATEEADSQQDPHGEDNSPEDQE